MALLQVRNGVSTLLTLEVWLLSAIICTVPLSVDAFFPSPDNKPGPDPRLKIVLHPPENVIIPINGVIFLHCSANYSAVQLSDDDYIDDDYGPYIMGDEAALSEQNDEPIQKIDDPSKTNDDNGCESEVLYQWLRNGQPIDKKNNSDFHFFCNGTVQITHSSRATAIYRCSARTRQPEIGTVLSKSSNVQAAVFEKRSGKFESNAELDSSVVINCPVDSVPKMDVIWSFEKNGSHINFAQAERYFQLNNGSLLIVNVKHEDGNVFRCEATNKYFKLPCIVRHTVHIVNGKTTKLTFLPKLQNDVILIPNGNPLRLYCATTTTGNSIHWTFTPRNRSTKPIPLTVQKPNELKIDSTTIHEHDGIYDCVSDTEYQSFDVTIATPPVILNGFTSKEESLGYYVTFNCNVTGNPKPTIEWYRNGELIHDDWIVNYKEPKLLIQTFEEMHKGVYQCIAKNPMGEVQATGLLSLKQKTYTDSPKNVKCFPISLSSFKITFEGPEHFKWSGITYYTSSRNEPKWLSAILHDSNKRIQNEFIVKNFKRFPFEPFMLFFRGMESTGSDVKPKGGIISFQFELSRLSEGVKCATQGWPVYGIFSIDGIFVWWPKVDHMNVTSYLVQFQSDDPINFTEHVIGTTKEINDLDTWTDVSGHLTTISAVTKVQNEVNGSGSKTRNETRSLITELRVDGSVSGVLIPNTAEVIVRVLVPVIDEDGELIQDARFVEWKKIRNTPGRLTKFQLVNKGTHHVTFGSTDPKLRCVRICYRGVNNNVCEKKQIENRMVEVDSLAPSTPYKFILSECNNLRTHYNEFVIQTVHDIPGAVTNHKIFKKDGIIVEWDAPVNPNGHLEYYLIEWTVANKTYSDRISFKSGTEKNAFKFPDLPEGVGFNVTIRAVSSFGDGNPIYINFKNVAEIPDGDPAEVYAERHDPRLGITIGAVLSLLCIIICMLIIVRHRKCIKSSQHNTNANGGVGRNSFQNRSGTDRSTNATTIITTSSTLITANCTLEGQEMQTLILASSMENIKAINGNGIKKDYEHLSNGIVAIRSNGGNDFPNPNQYSDDEDNNQDMSHCGLISSTPKSVHKVTILRNSSSNDPDEAKNTVTRISVYSVQEDLEVLDLDQSPFKSPLKTTSSRNSLSHSIDRRSPTIQRMGDIIKTKSPSQQNLMQKARASGSSASTSSGLNIDTSSNSTSTPLDHRQSQLYLFNEKDLNDDNQIIENGLMDESSIHFELKGKNGIKKISAPPSDEISIDVNDENHCPKRIQPKWDYRRPIVGPNDF